MEIVLVVAAILLFWFIIGKKGVENAATLNESSRREITEEDVFRMETKFEKDLEQRNLPDSIDGQEVYIFRTLMSPWYKELSSKNRYNKVISQKLYRDWIDYMSSLNDRSTYNYLSLEAEDNKTREEYREDHIKASKKVFSIEEAFATKIGKGAKAKLAKVRAMNFSAFDNEGNLKSKSR